MNESIDVHQRRGLVQGDQDSSGESQHAIEPAFSRSLWFY